VVVSRKNSDIYREYVFLCTACLVYSKKMEQMALHAFADWVQSHPTEQEEFKEWYAEYWPDYSRHCYDISRNVFIMQQCLKQFERVLEPNMAWQDAICHSELLKQKRQICLSVEVSPDEFFDDGTTEIYMRRCRTIFLRYFSDGGE